MKKYELKVKSMEEMWEFDKELLRKYNSNLNIKWNDTLLNDRDAYELLVLKEKRWTNPSEPIIINDQILSLSLEKLISNISHLWETDFKLPDIEVLSTDNYLPRIQQLEIEVNKMFGYGSVCQSPPTMYLNPTKGKLLMPKEFLIRVPKNNFELSDSNIMSADYNIIEKKWDRPFFENALSEEISHAIFRQLRKEWEISYVNVMKTLGPEKERRISRFNEVIVQYVKDLLTKKSYEEWGLYNVTDKIRRVWGNRYARADYLAIDALHTIKSLSQISLLDDVSIDSNSVKINFYFDHLHHTEKEKGFNKSKNNN